MSLLVSPLGGIGDPGVLSPWFCIKGIRSRSVGDVMGQGGRWWRWAGAKRFSLPAAPGALA